MNTTPPAGRIVESEEQIAAIVRAMQVVAVVGMKGEDRADEPAFAIPQMVAARGRRVIPVNPRLERALGEKAYADLAAVPEAFDLVDVFRRSDAIPELAEQILALSVDRRPRVVWLQSGIRHDDAAARLAAAGIDIVQDRCLGVYASRYLPRPAAS